ncbi:phosphodiesterase [bacterium BMS3Abin02]|nr:phosphodiesterase [bacterium BMS3Abin02]GBE22480.1 phosphodiesterase [bacterium BMS3Bbin01]
MRVGLVSDVHGNTVALDAVLDEIARRGVDVIVCLGDLAANGPDPAGSVERIAALACPVVMGNTDADMVNMPDWWHDPNAVGAPEPARRIAEISLWCSERLTDEHRRFLAGLPKTIEVDLGAAGRLLGFHGSPRSATDVITATTPSDELDEMLTGADQAVLAGGHTHVSMVRRHHTQTIINPGSVGLPFVAYGHAGQVAVLDHAAYALVTADELEVGIELRQVPVDREQLSRQVEASGMPHSAWWVALRR